MKSNSIFFLSAVLVFGPIGVPVFAQQLARTGTSPKLDDAIALINDGKPTQARELIATIAPSEPEFGTAKCYDALCLYDMKDYLGYLKMLELPTVKAAMGTTPIKEDLAIKQVDALFRYRKFVDVQPKISALQMEVTNATRLAALTEYRLASLFEWGMKKAQDACITKDTNQFNIHWTEGKANLEEFLSVASGFQGTNYGVLPDRELRKDVWVARLTLGDEKAVLDEIPSQDSATREKASLLRVQLYQKLQPEKTDRNLQMMADFLQQFPDAKGRRRVEFDMASISFQRGKELSKEAETAEQSGDTRTAGEKRASAAGYFQPLRSLQSGAVADKDSGIEASDLLDSREDLLYSYALEKDYATLATLTASMAANAAPEDLNGVMAKLYGGIVLVHQNPPRNAEAAVIFDDVLKLGFKGRPDHDRMLITAARWQVHLAIKAGDSAGAQRVVQMVGNSACVENLKKNFIKDHATYAATRTDNSK